MEEIDKYYKILRVKPNASFKTIKRSYYSLILRYHPSKPEGRFHRDYFVDLVLAYDLFSKIERHSTDFLTSNKELYDEW